MARQQPSRLNSKKLAHYKRLLLADLRRFSDHIDQDQAAALDAADEDAKESADLAARDVIQDVLLQLSDQESQMIADIDQALRRISEGTYGICRRCGHMIDERRLEAMPTARYDAQCQAIIEDGKGRAAGPSL